jgi:hypothetical protein
MDGVPLVTKVRVEAVTTAAAGAVDTDTLSADRRLVRSLRALIFI